MFPSDELLNALQTSLASDLRRFVPELLISLAILLCLGSRAFRLGSRLHASLLAVPFAIAAIALLCCQTTVEPREAFSGLLVLDPLANYLRGLLLIFAVLALILGKLTGIPDRDDSADYVVLLLGGTLGMMLMTSANHLLMVFVGLEMASLPCYALAGFLKDRRTAGEAALKYVIYGSAASSVALFGISLLVISAGTGSLTGVAAALTTKGFDPLAVVGLVMLLVGFAFKLSAVPFHFWCPDVFAGAAAEVGAFLSVASKTAAVGLILRVVLSFEHAATGCEFSQGLGVGLLIVAAITTTFGNLAALAQTDMKRMLAYSTIAHAGYMLMAIATRSSEASSAVLFYLTAYLPTSLGAFAVVAVVRNRTGSETIEAFRGLLIRSPLLGVTTILFFLSLLGLPPLAGFAGKFQVFVAIYDAGHIGGDLGRLYQIGLAIAIVNTVLGAGYYLRVVRAVTLDEPTGTWNAGKNHTAIGVYLLILTLAVVALGLTWG